MHLLVLLVYDSALPRIFHAMSYSVFFSFRDHICLLSSVAFRNLGLIKDCLWLANLSLNSVSVSPTYDSVFFSLVRSLSFSRVVTVAWYTISCSLQLPFRGQLALLRQLQTFFASVSVLVYIYIYIVNCYQLQLAMAESARLKEHNYAIFIRK